MAGKKQNKKPPKNPTESLGLWTLHFFQAQVRKLGKQHYYTFQTHVPALMFLGITEVSHLTWSILPPQLTYDNFNHILAEKQVFELFTEQRQPLTLWNYVPQQQKGFCCFKGSIPQPSKITCVPRTTQDCFWAARMSRCYWLQHPDPLAYSYWEVKTSLKTKLIAGLKTEKERSVT